MLITHLPSETKHANDFIERGVGRPVVKRCGLLLFLFFLVPTRVGMCPFGVSWTGQGHGCDELSPNWNETVSFSLWVWGVRWRLLAP